jgi:hypothetical protein
MAENPLSGHTAANITNAVDGLRDNDQILSASLTNMLEGAHGNGILLLDDTAAGGGNRNTPQNLSGAVAKSTAYQITIKGGYTILDGILYKFADGYSGASPASITVDLTKADGSGTAANNLHKRAGETYTPLTSGQECLFTIYLSSDTDGKHVQFVQSAAVTTGTGVYPVSDTTYLTEPDTGNSVKQSVVLATVRAVYNGSENLGTNNGGLKINITEVNDKRVFVRPSPIYLSPVTTGAVASTATVNSALKLDQQYTGQHGDLNASSLGAVWMSKSSTKTTGGGTQVGAVGDDVVFLSLNEGGNRKTARLAPDKLYTDSSWTDTTNYFTFDGPNAFLLAPQQGSTYLYPDNDSADFPPGHIVYVKNTLSSGDAFQFENSGADFALAAGASAIFVRTTSNTAGARWQKLVSSTGGGSGAVAAVTTGSADRVATFGGADSLVGEELLTFNETYGLKVGASGNGADLTLYSATANNVGVVWDHDGQTNGTLTLGANDYGIDFKAFGDTASKYIEWDASADTFKVAGTLDIDGAVDIGLDGTGFDVKIYGDTASAYTYWDQNEDHLILSGTSKLHVGPVTYTTTGVTINNGAGYALGTTGAMVTDGVAAATVITTGDVIYKSDGTKIGVVSGSATTGGAAGTVTVSTGTLVSLSDDDILYKRTTSTALKVATATPYITLKNTGAGNADGDQKGRIDFQDHSDTVFGRIQVSHDGSADDTKSDMILSVHDGSNLVEGMRIDSAKLATFAGAVTVGGDLTVNGTTTTVNSTTISVDDPIITIGGDDAPSSDDNKDRGIVFRWYDSGTSAAKTGFFGYDDSSGHFVYLKDATVSNEVLTTTINTANLGTIRANFHGDLTATAVNCIGDLIVDADTSGSDNVPDSPYAFMVDVSEHEVLLGSTSKMGINQASPKASIHVSGTAFEFADNTGITSNSSTGVVQIPICPKGDFRAVEALLSTYNSTDNANFETTKILIIHDGTNSHHTVYGTITDANSNTATHTYDVTIPGSGGNQDKICITIDYAQIGGANKDFVTKISWIGVE